MQNFMQMLAVFNWNGIIDDALNLQSAAGDSIMCIQALRFVECSAIASNINDISDHSKCLKGVSYIFPPRLALIILAGLRLDGVWGTSGYIKGCLCDDIDGGDTPTTFTYKQTSIHSA